MRRYFSAPTPRFGKQSSRLSIGNQQRSPYYWWWQYLRRNADYIACCERGGKGKLAKLYADFGDVQNDNFHEWWTSDDRGATLFAEQALAIPFGELVTTEQWQTDWRAEDVLVVAVPLEMSKRFIKSAFSKLLDKRHTSVKRGRPSIATLKEKSTALYALERNYTIAALQSTLAVYDLWFENELRKKTDKLTLWQIGAELILNRSAVLDALSEDKNDRLSGRNTLGATVHRYVTQAKRIIGNTAKGKFPMSD
jgi:hypothetical protein